MRIFKQVKGPTLSPEEGEKCRRIRLIKLQIRFQALKHRPTRNRHFYDLLRIASPFHPGTSNDAIQLTIDFVVRSIDVT